LKHCYFYPPQERHSNSSIAADDADQKLQCQGGTSSNTKSPFNLNFSSGALNKAQVEEKLLGSPECFTNFKFCSAVGTDQKKKRVVYQFIACLVCFYNDATHVIALSQLHKQ